MQLNQFNGGLNIRVSPYLIATNEAQICSNMDVASISLSGLPTDRAEGNNFGSNSSFIFYKGQWVAKPSTTDFVEYNNILYSSDGVSVPQKTNDGINFFNLGITTPVSRPSITALNSIPSDNKEELKYRQYVYTYYNSNDGSESAPSPLSEEVKYIEEGFTVGNFILPTDSQVTSIRLYRVGGDLSIFTLVDTITSPYSDYTDNKLDIDIAGNHQLDTTNAGQAPQGISHIVENMSMLFGTKGNSLYYTDVAKPNNWSPYYFINFKYDITGLGSTQNGLLVFTKNATYIVSGNSPMTLSMSLLHNSQGCINHKTIKYINNVLVWLSLDGICTSSGARVEVLSYNKLGRLTVSSVDAEIYDGRYFLFYSGGTKVLDYRFGNPIFYDLDLQVTGSYYDEKIDLLYYTDLSGNLYSLFQGNDIRNYSYKTGKLADGSASMRKNYNDIYMFSTGVLEYKIYIDDVQVTSGTLVQGYNQVNVPKSHSFGYHIEFEFSGKGSLIELEYKVEGRQNGR